MRTADPVWSQPKPPSSRLYDRLIGYCAGSGAFILICFVLSSWVGIGHHAPPYRPWAPDYPPTNEPRPHHPIDDLIATAEAQYQDVMARATFNLADAESTYIARRGRRPPPRFDIWFDYAQRHNSIIVEDFFDRIYDDLNPFWALPPLQIRQQANNFIHRISIRNGTAESRSDQQRVWLDLWKDAIQSIAHYLPDLDLAINEMDESRLVVPWETINDYVQQERTSRKVVNVSDATTTFASTVVSNTEEVPNFDYAFRGGVEYWELAVVGCPPDSPARADYTPEYDYTRPPPLPSTRPPHSHEGFVSNWTLAKSICDNPSLQQLHGTFVEPVSMSTSAKLFPMFGGSKLPMNNEILLPAAMYWTDDPFYSGGLSHGNLWPRKLDKLIWKGAATGGRNRLENWTRFQRHRFVAMANGTSVKVAEQGSPDAPPNIKLPDLEAYNVSALREGHLGDWLSSFSEPAFGHLICFPDPQPPSCSYTNHFYTIEQAMPMSEQYKYKYLPDIDGNSFSGRYRGFLGSTSLPIKATIYNEWHDSRLIPWKHFVPMDNTFVDFYSIMEYFLGYRGRNGHDDVAEKIASAGKAWAEKTLRREDMQVYVFRLLLEYARICDDERDRLAWVGT